MAMIICPECKKQMSSQAATCPHCGWSKKKQKNGIGFWEVVFAIIVAVVVMSLG